MKHQFLFDGPEDAPITILFGHGAGSQMDLASMTAAAGALAAGGFRVARFEFAYMASRRDGTGRKPSPRAELLKDEYLAAVAKLAAQTSLIIGGKSLGGRVASMVADQLFTEGKIAGLFCLSYPFHPPGKPHQLRTKHLAVLRTPTLICQGTRDEFGSREEVAGYGLSPAITLLWLEDGDHALKPRKAVSGFSTADHLKTVADAAREFAARITAAAAS